MYMCVQYNFSICNMPCDYCLVQQEECHGPLKHVLKPYDNHSHRQFSVVEIACNFSMMQAAHATKITCDNHRQKSF